MLQYPPRRAPIAVVGALCYLCEVVMRVSIRVFIVTSNPRFQQGLQWSLEPLNDITIVGAATTSQEALAAISAMAIDVLLVDIRTPGFEGLAITQGLVQPAITAGVLLLHLTRGAIRGGQPVLVGAAAVVPQDSAPDTLVSTIRTVAKG
jgi:DNA-binding NarL/FixJ family response regulator